MKRFTNTVGKFPVLCAALAGGLAMTLTMVAFLVYLTVWELQQMEAEQRKVSVLVRAVAVESRRVLADVVQRYQPVCDDETLVQLRTEVFATRFLEDIGIFDEAGRLVCTTVLGRLPRPLTVPPPDFNSAGVDGRLYGLSNDVAVLVGKGQFKTSVMRHGRYNVVINPRVLEDIYRSGEDIIRIVSKDGRLFTVFEKPGVDAGLRVRLGQSDMVRPVRRFLWSEMAFVSALPVEDSVLLLQRVMPAAQFFATNASPILLAFFLALLIGALTYAAVLPVCRSWRQIERRIKELLTESNVICMYQPIVDLATAKPIGCEVLMRLRDGADVLYPDAVIPAVIKRGLTRQLDHAVVRRAIFELCANFPEQSGLHVSFNLFPQNVNCRNVRELIEGELRRLGHEGFTIDLEVIEQDYQSNLVDEIAGLKRAGYRVSVDDFGTGYSNLGSIKTLSPDFLKIDKSFVFEMEDASVRSSLIPEIVAIARAVGAKVIAEGIENQAQRSRLLEFGVDFGQGYLFARPMEIDAFVRYWKSASVDSSPAAA